ncbi:hypothetical protein PCANB_002741 [Pneumocystis canis]|nr:hypothetical protein PCANB_002741 [Pneumocystis canis]
MSETYKWKSLGTVIDKKQEIIDIMIQQSIFNDPMFEEMQEKSEIPLNIVLKRVDSEINKTRKIISDLILKNQALFSKMLNQKTEICEKIRNVVNNSIILSEIDTNNQKNLKILHEKSEVLKEFQDLIQLKTLLKDSVLKLKSINNLINKIENLIAQDDLFDAFSILKMAETECDSVHDSEKIVILGLLKKKLISFKSILIEKINNIWDNFITFGDACVIKKELKDFLKKNISLISFVEMSIELKVFDLRMLDVSNNFVSKFLLFFLNKENCYTLEWNENDDEYQLAIKFNTSLERESFFSFLLKLVNFIDKAFPSIVLLDLAKYLFPRIQSTLINDYTDSILPNGIEDLDQFNRILLEGSKFNDKIKQTVWGNQLEIEKWIKQASEAWILKYKSNAIDSVRKIFNSKNSGNIIIRPGQNIKEIKTVQNKSIGFTDDNDWRVNWDNKEVTDIEEKDTMIENDTWGLDNDIVDVKFENSPLKDESWNWDDNDDWGLDKKDLGNDKEKMYESEISIYESYTISFMPKQIILAVQKHLHDIKKLMNPRYANYIMAPFFSQLSDSITMILSAYRALVPLYYDKLSASPMLLYNDFIYLSIHLQELYDGSEVLQCILDESNAFRNAGNLIYLHELQIQKNHIILILERTNGFTDCADKQQIERCTFLISELQEKIKTLSELWKQIFSREVLFESIGQLLETAIVYIITAIKNISDISEAESKQLSKLCNQFAQIEDIFITEEQALPITPTYVPNWLKFRYLIEILEASIQDVMYLYNSGALIDFDKEEIISLLKTLFAETPSRAENISKIRNS